MKKLTLVGLMTAALVLMLSSSAMAQGGEAANNALRSGQSALSFAVPSGGNPHVDRETASGEPAQGIFGIFGAGAGSVLGYHYMVTDQMRAGLNLGFTLSTSTVKTPTADGFDEEDATAFGLTLAPQVNYYTSNRGTVAPYFFGQIDFSTFSDGSDSTSGNFDEFVDDDDVTGFNPSEQSTLDLKAGMGVEWFPVTRFSISGQVGLNLALIGQDRPISEQNPENGVVERGLGVNLFTSSLAANIYF
ncbi:MAG: hypothetical protein ACOC9J_01655 [Persicimonas sp.]